MSDKRIVFPKDVIKRAEKYDFSDDGTSFRGYMYKDILPITYTRYKGDVYASIRMDYCHLEVSLDAGYIDPLYDEYRDASRMSNRFNGVDVEYFDMDKFLENCEFIYQFIIKYNSPQEELKRVLSMLTSTEDKIQRLVNLKNACLDRIKELGGETVCLQM